MIGNIKPYPTMKESGVPWLGKVPEHWGLRRTKTLLRERVQKGFPDEPLLAATQTKGVVRKEQYENRTVLALKDLHLLKLVRFGDFVISLRSFQGGIEYAREQGIISPAYTVLYPAQPELHGFLAWLFKSKPYIENLSLYVTGIRQGQNIDYEKLSRSELPLPPLPEQTAIVRFLDHADRRIRRYNRTKQKLIELLEEQKQVIIHRAVTRGLDPNVHLKPSGLEWLGDVPEHWEVARLKTRLLRNDAGAWGSDFSESGTVVLRSTEQTVDGGWRIESPARRLLSQEDRDATLLLTGDLVVTKSSGSAAHIGKTSLVTSEIERMCCGFSNFMQRLRPAASAYPQFLWFFLNNKAGRDQLVFYSSTTTGLGNLSGTILGNLWVAFPPIDEQEHLCMGVAMGTQRLQTAIARAQDEISLLHEYRTRLIADVVTGKFDVREAAARLPDEAEEPHDEADALSDAEKETEVVEELEE